MRKWVLSCLIITLFLINPLKFSISEKNIVTKNSLHEIQEIGQYDDNYGSVICIDGDNDTLYVGTNIGFLLLNRSDPTTLSYLGEITLDERVNFIHIKNKTLFVYTSSGLTIYNVTNFENLIKIASYPSIDDMEQYHFIIRDEYGFKEIEDDDNKDNIVILNISNPQNIFEISRFVVPFSRVRSYFVKDNFIYISTFDGLHIVNITDPTNPNEIAYFTAIHHNGYEKVFVDNQKMIYLFSRTEHAFLVLNGSDSSPLTILDEISFGGITSIIEYENNLLVETNKYYTELIVINTTDPTNLIIKSNITYGTLGLPDANLSFKWYYDSIFYISKTSEVFILDFGDVMNPEMIELFDCGGFAYDIEVIGNHVYIPEGIKGIEIIDISNKSNPTKVSSWQSEISSYGLLKDNEYIYSHASYDFDIYKLTNPLEFNLIGSYRSGGLPLGSPSKNKDYIYFIGGCEGALTIINVKDKTNPEIEKLYQGYGFRSITVQGNRLYGIGLGNFPAFFIFDISKPKNIELIHEYNVTTFSDYSEIVVVKNKVYIALEDRFMVLELSKDEVISKEELIDSTLYPLDLVITENYVIIGSNEGVKIIQLATMTEVVHYHDGGRAMELAVINNTIFVADGYDNLEILETNFELGKVIGPNTIAIDIPLSKLLGVVIPVVIIALEK
ncbi:MAG: hypothetical protein GPJ52_06505 [Candidatus Heimdallarchaeota archaeon]|nr:hypothetical protein [Candidatus Heimdallarchaeota archaeon]